MHNMARVAIPSEDIFSTTVSGQPKSDILIQLQARHPGAACHFVEDKLSTLEKVPVSGHTPSHAADVAVCEVPLALCWAWTQQGGLHEQQCASQRLTRHASSTVCRCARCQSWLTGSSTWWTGGTTQPRSGSRQRPTRALRSSIRLA